MSLSDALMKGRIRVGAAPRWVGRREVVGVGRPGWRVPLGAVGRGIDTRLAGPAVSCHRDVSIQVSDKSTAVHWMTWSRCVGFGERNRENDAFVPDRSSGGFA